MGTSINFKRPDGKDAAGYLANAARGNAPGVVVIQEWWGLQDQIKGMCDRFALAGFDALAPIFSELDLGNDDERSALAAMLRAKALPQERTFALRSLRARGAFRALAAALAG